MTSAKKLISFVSVLVLMSLVISPIFATTADAVAVLESPATATAHVGRAFEVLARGRAGNAADNRSEFEADSSTNMTLEFTIIGRGERGVILGVVRGHFSLNSTLFSFIDGRGFAARPVQSDLNITATFGFRINMTGPGDIEAQLIFLGGVRGAPDYRPLLVMRGQLIIGNTIHVFGQLGRIFRV